MEIEVKILEIDKDAVERRLTELGAEKLFSGELVAEYFTSDALQEGMTLRLRKRGGVTKLTVKKNVSNTETKIREEHEVEVSDFDVCKKQLQLLGYVSDTITVKHRTSYKLKNGFVEIDEYSQPTFPTFLEIEAPSEEEVFAIAELLGYKREDCKPWDGKDLVKHYG